MDPEEMLATARQMVDMGMQNGITLRIIGHLAVREHVNKNRELIDSLKRIPTHDIDFMGYSKDIKQMNHMFIEQLGYKPDPAVAFSQEYGVGRLIYHHDNGLMAEIFLDKLRMSHTLDFQGRLELDSPTISLVDLLLSKLQIHQINEKDLKDIIVLLVEHDLGNEDQERIDVIHLLNLIRNDWGLYYTSYNNLMKSRDLASHMNILDSLLLQTINNRILTIIKRMEAEPKSFLWKVRARIGTSIKWYEDVGDVHS